MKPKQMIQGAISTLIKEVTQLKNDFRKRAERQKNFHERLSAIEKRLNGQTKTRDYILAELDRKQKRNDELRLENESAAEKIFQLSRQLAEEMQARRIAEDQIKHAAAVREIDRRRAELQAPALEEEQVDECQQELAQTTQRLSRLKGR